MHFILWILAMALGAYFTKGDTSGLKAIGSFLLWGAFMIGVLWLIASAATVPIIEIFGIILGLVTIIILIAFVIAQLFF